MLSWLSSEHTSLCNLLPDSPTICVPSHPKQCRSMFLGSLTQQTPWFMWVKG